MIYPSKGTITQGFSSSHMALDIKAGYRQPVYAPHDGIVSFTGQLGSGTNDAGNCVDILFGSYYSRLAHLDQITVSKGHYVKQGQQIGYEGYSGYTQPDNVPAGSHVHWVLWFNDARVDPRLHIGKEIDETMKEGDVKNLIPVLLLRNATQDDINFAKGKTVTDWIYAIVSSPEYQALINDFVNWKAEGVKLSQADINQRLEQIKNLATL